MAWIVCLLPAPAWKNPPCSLSSQFFTQVRTKQKIYHKRPSTFFMHFPFNTRPHVISSSSGFIIIIKMMWSSRILVDIFPCLTIEEKKTKNLLQLCSGKKSNLHSYFPRHLCHSWWRQDRSGAENVHIFLSFFPVWCGEWKVVARVDLGNPCSRSNSPSVPEERAEHFQGKNTSSLFSPVSNLLSDNTNSMWLWFVKKPFFLLCFSFLEFREACFVLASYTLSSFVFHAEKTHDLKSCVKKWTFAQKLPC